MRLRLRRSFQKRSQCQLEWGLYYFESALQWHISKPNVAEHIGRATLTDKN